MAAHAFLINGEQIVRTESHQTTNEHAIDNAEAGEELAITIEALNDSRHGNRHRKHSHTVQGAVDLPSACSDRAGI